MCKPHRSSSRGRVFGGNCLLFGWRPCIIYGTCRRDGIGRRTGLKIPRWRHRAGSTPAAGTSSSQATYRLRRFFYEKSSRAHSAAPRFPTKFCFANFRGDPGRPKGGHKRHIACGDFFAKSRRRAHSAAAPSPHEILLRKLPRGPRRPGGHERHIACGDFFAKSRQAPAEIGTKGARCRSFLALHPL